MLILQHSADQMWYSFSALEEQFSADFWEQKNLEREKVEESRLKVRFQL